MLSIAINGGLGRMGQEIRNLIDKLSEKYVLSFAKIKEESNFEVSNYLTSFPLHTNAQVLIDFSSPDSICESLEWCLSQKIPLVIGTSGISKDIQERINLASKQIAILQSANMSLSVNVLYKVSELVAQKLDNYEVEITESHHRYKKDSPSGTALSIGNIIASARGQNFDEVAVFDRTGNQNPVRSSSEIGFSVIRGGDIVGRHTVNFISDGEELSFTSMINNRESFARGALLAAEFVTKAKPGLYTMEDALGLKGDLV